MNSETNKELLIRIDERQKTISEHVAEIEEHLRELNGSVARNQAGISKNSFNIKVLGVVLVAGSFIWIKESRDFILTLLKSLI